MDEMRGPHGVRGGGAIDEARVVEARGTGALEVNGDFVRAIGAIKGYDNAGGGVVQAVSSTDRVIVIEVRVDAIAREHPHSATYPI